MDKARRDYIKAWPGNSRACEIVELITDLEAAEARINELKELLGAYSATRYPTLAQQVESAEKRIAELEESRRWISVNERLPEEDTAVLAYWFNPAAIEMAYFYSSDEWLDSQGICMTTPSYWMPLPAPPTLGVNEPSKHSPDCPPEH